MTKNELNKLKELRELFIDLVEHVDRCTQYATDHDEMQFHANVDKIYKKLQNMIKDEF